MLILGVLCTLISKVQIQVDPDKVLGSISNDMYGSCIEDVNHEIYGGLYSQRIFGESFEEPGDVVGAAGWHSLNGDWRSKDGEAICSAGPGPMLLLEGRKISDEVVEARVRTKRDEDGSAGLIVRVSNASAGVDTFDGYEVAFQAKNKTLMLGKHQHDFKMLQTSPAPVATGESHRLRVVLEGPRIRVFLDDERNARLDFTDRDHPLLSGTIALRPWQAECAFGDVKISGTPILTELEARGISGMWDPVGKASYSLDHHAFNGSQCQKIVNRGSPFPVGVANRGLNRWGISVKSGQPMDGQIALRGDVGVAEVALQSADGSRTYAAQKLPVSQNWRSIQFRLKPSVSDSNARFVVLLPYRGTLFLDQVMLVDSAPFQGLAIRADIARSMVKEGLTFLRYGGTMVNAAAYRWKNMIGSPAHRSPYKGYWYPYSTNGFGIFEFLKFCEAAHFRSAFAINIEESEQDASDLADYLTASTANKWGAQRAADGHPAPYHPEYIEIGNEEGIGESRHSDLLHYVERFRVLERAIHRRNPNIKLVCAAWWIEGSADMKPVFEAVDGRATAWDIHVESDNPKSGLAVDRQLTDIEKCFKRWNTKSRLKVVVFEENGGLHNMQRALGHATTVNATRRHGDFVLADCPANCLQPWLQNDNGWDQGQIFFTPNRVWGMPPFYAQQLLSSDRQPLWIESKAPDSLDVVATRSADGKSVVLTIVNISSKSIPTSVALAHFPILTASARCVCGELGAVNTLSDPQKCSISPIPLSVRQNQLELTFPAFSVTSIHLRATEGPKDTWNDQ